MKYQLNLKLINIKNHNSKSLFLYTRYPIVAHALGLAAASKGILHTITFHDIGFLNKVYIISLSHGGNEA